MPGRCRSVIAAAGILLMSVSSLPAATFDCGKVGTAFDDLFADGNKRVQAVLAEFKALPATSSEQQKDAVRKKFCSIAGEVVGLYKFIQALAKECSAAGQDMKPLLEVVNKQLELAQQGVKAPCL